MIQGVVNSVYEAVITLSVQGPEGQAREVDAVVDTGFTGFLTLPPALVAELGLPFETTGHATLADGLPHSEPASLRDYPTQVQDTRSIKNLDATRRELVRGCRDRLQGSQLGLLPAQESSERAV